MFGMTASIHFIHNRGRENMIRRITEAEPDTKLLLIELKEGSMSFVSEKTSTYDLACFSSALQHIAWRTHEE